MVEKADRRERRYIKRPKNVQIKQTKISEKIEVTQETNVESDENNLKEVVGNVEAIQNQFNNEEMSLDEKLETNSENSKITEPTTSKDIVIDSNLNTNKDELTMKKQFAEQLSFYKEIQPSCENTQVSKIETCEDSSQFDLKEVVANVQTVESQINKEECSDENVEVDSSEIKETAPSKVIIRDLNLNSKKDEVAMNEMFADQLSIYKKVKPSSETKSAKKSNKKESITFSLVNDDLLEKYFKDDSASQVKKPVTGLIDDKSSRESTLNKCNDELVPESSLNIMSDASRDTGYNSNTDNQSKFNENSDNDDEVVSKCVSTSNVEKSEDGSKSEVDVKFSSDEIKWNLDSFSTEANVPNSFESKNTKEDNNNKNYRETDKIESKDGSSSIASDPNRILLDAKLSSSIDNKENTDKQNSSTKHLSTEIINYNSVEETETTKIAECAELAEEKETQGGEAKLDCQNNSRAENSSLLDSSTFHDQVASTSSIVKDANNLDNNLLGIKQVNVEEEKVDNQLSVKSDQILNKQNDLQQVDEIKNEKLKDDEKSFLELLSDSNIVHNAVQSESKQITINASNSQNINEPFVLLGDLDNEASEENINNSNEGDQMLEDLGDFSELNLNELITDLNDEPLSFSNYFTNDDTQSNNKGSPRYESSSKKDNNETSNTENSDYQVTKNEIREENKVFVKPDISYLMLFRYALFKQQGKLNYMQVIEWIREKFHFYNCMDLETMEQHFQNSRYDKYLEKTVSKNKITTFSLSKACLNKFGSKFEIIAKKMENNEYKMNKSEVTDCFDEQQLKQENTKNKGKKKESKTLTRKHKNNQEGTTPSSETYDDLTVTDPAAALRYILKKKIPGCEKSSQRMPASSAKLPEKALKIVPLVKKNSLKMLENGNSTKLKVAETMEDSQNVPEPIETERIFLINNNRSLKKFQSGQVSRKSIFNQDNPLDLSIAGARISIKSPGNDKIISPQSSDGGWDFLEKHSGAAQPLMSKEFDFKIEFNKISKKYYELLKKQKDDSDYLKMTQEANEDLKVQLINSSSDNKFLNNQILILENKLKNQSKSKPFSGSKLEIVDNAKRDELLSFLHLFVKLRHEDRDVLMRVKKMQTSQLREKLTDNIYMFDEAIKKIKWIENENSLLKSEVNIMHNCSQEKCKTIKSLEIKEESNKKEKEELNFKLKHEIELKEMLINENNKLREEVSEKDFKIKEIEQKYEDLIREMSNKKK